MSTYHVCLCCMKASRRLVLRFSIADCHTPEWVTEIIWFILSQKKTLSNTTVDSRLGNSKSDSGWALPAWIKPRSHQKLVVLHFFFIYFVALGNCFNDSNEITRGREKITQHPLLRGSNNDVAVIGTVTESWMVPRARTSLAHFRVEFGPFENTLTKIRGVRNLRANGSYLKEAEMRWNGEKMIEKKMRMIETGQ